MEELWRIQSFWNNAPSRYEPVLVLVSGRRVSAGLNLQYNFHVALHCFSAQVICANLTIRLQPSQRRKNCGASSRFGTMRHPGLNNIPVWCGGDGLMLASF